MEHIPNMPLYLFYGNKTESILAARDAVLNRVVPPDFRNENLTEYYPTSNTDMIKLAGLLDEIAGDLSMVSFIPGATKCVIVTNPAEIYGSGGERAKKSEKAEKAAKAEVAMAHWLERELPQTGHTIVLLAFEDESNQREIDQRCPLYQAVQKVGYLRGYKDNKAFFRIEEAILHRQAAACITAVRDLWKTGKGDMQVYNSVVRALRYLMQANIVRERRWENDTAAQAVYFPGDPQRNLFKTHRNVQSKYIGFKSFQTRDLLKAYQGVLNVYRAMRPRPGDQYVPDAQGLLEQTLLELLNSPSPRG